MRSGSVTFRPDLHTHIAVAYARSRCISLFVDGSVVTKSVEHDNGTVIVNGAQRRTTVLATIFRHQMCVGLLDYWALELQLFSVILLKE